MLHVKKMPVISTSSTSPTTSPTSTSPTSSTTTDSTGSTLTAFEENLVPLSELFGQPNSPSTAPTPERLFYKCRAECPADAEKLRKRCKARLGKDFNDFSVEIDPEFGEAEITFSCYIPISRIHHVLQIDRMTDCHVMRETLNLASRYTGERNYGSFHGTWPKFI